MVKRNYKGRCEKRQCSKCSDTVRTYNPIQYAYADMIQKNERVKSFSCNVPLEGLEVGEYSTDFVCVKQDEELMVRECIDRRHLLKPMTIKLLDASRKYWSNRGVRDWGIVVNAEE